MTRFSNSRDYWAGALVALLGAGAIYQGSQYGLGTLTNMGSGFFPVMLGAGLVLCGALMAVARTPQHQAHDVRAPDWRGAAAILAAASLFIGLASRAGLAPATFACVLVGALGTRSTRLLEAALLASAVTLFAVLLFHYGLQVEFPIVRGVLP